MEATDRPTILIVEDEPGIVEALRRLLAGAGYEPIFAKDGLDGLQRVSRDAPHLIITDIIMPRGDGIELIAASKQIAPATPILAISGALEEAYGGALDPLEDARLLGADAVLPKPFDPEELLAAVTGLLERFPAVRSRAAGGSATEP